MEVIDDDCGDAGLDGPFKLLRTLVVAVEMDVGGIDACGLRRCQFAAADNIESDALLRKKAEKGDVGEGLGGVDDGAFAGVMGIESCAKASGRITQLGLVKDI